MNFRRLAICAAAGMFVMPSAASADPGPDSPTATHTNPSSCLGAERATRNSDGGDRAQGAFGPAQAAWIDELAAAGLSYGEWLAQWKESC